MPRIASTHVGTGPDGADIFRPIIIVSIGFEAVGVRVPALVDSGADNTLVPFELIRPLGVDFATLPSGPGGSMLRVPEQVVLDAAGFERATVPASA